MNSPVLPLTPALSLAQAKETLESVAHNLGRVLLGKEEVSRRAVSCLVARGHLLLEDVPGVGKTTLAEALARSWGLGFARIQFTSDLLPSDITGAPILRPQTGQLEFRPGPLFHPLVLADELNRAPPRTQSALLEAMAQHQVSVDGVTHRLPEPFTVVATQNPLDLAGTYPLPDSQLDRFLMRLSVGHPTPELEAKLVTERGLRDPVQSLPQVASAESLLALWRLCAEVSVSPNVATYAVALAHATRSSGEVEHGVSTRAVLALVAAAKAQALWEERNFVTPGDLRGVLVPVFAHRLMLRSSLGGAYARDEAARLVEELGRKVPEPR